MKLVGVALFTLVALTACGQSIPSAPVAAKPEPVIAAAPRPVSATAAARFDGYGAVHFGMDEAAFDHAWSGTLRGKPAAGSSCFSKRPPQLKSPRDLAFMFEHGRFQRYDVALADQIAPGGGRVGMSVAQIRHLYGTGMVEQPHKYVVGARTLQVKAPQGNVVLVFETDAAGKVIRWSVGVPPQIHYVEGCG